MKITRITSRQNQTVRDAAALAGSGERRKEEGLFLCEGARLCRDAAYSGVSVQACFFTEQAQSRYAPYLEAVLKVSREAYLVEEHVAKLLASTKSSQEIFCVCRWPQGLLQGTVSREALKGSLIVLENLQDPGNLGTVLRTAEALGVGQAVLLGDCCDPLSPKVLRSSMGAVFRMSVLAEASAEKLCGCLKEAGYTLHAAVPESTALPVTGVDFSRGLHAVFIGNEGNGLTEETIGLCGSRVTIPMLGRAESLNASAAATILLWEMNRRNGHG